MTIAISTLRLGTMSNFVHFVTDKATQATFLVDPSWDAQAIIAHIESNQLIPKGILLTHSHGDHISALPAMLKKYRLPTYITRPEFRLGRARIKKPHYIEDGDCLTLGESSIRVIETPGHTVGGASFLADNALICGDTLFIDGCGRCDFYESDVEQMWNSLQRLKTLPDDTVIYCGHDYGQTATDTLGHQKQTNPYLLIDDPDFFADFRLHLQSEYRSIPFAPSSREEMQAIRQRHQKT